MNGFSAVWLWIRGVTSDLCASLWSSSRLNRDLTSFWSLSLERIFQSAICCKSLFVVLSSPSLVSYWHRGRHGNANGRSSKGLFLLAMVWPNQLKPTSRLQTNWNTWCQTQICFYEDTSKSNGCHLSTRFFPITCLDNSLLLKDTVFWFEL